MPRVVHFEIQVDDLDRAEKVYTELFGWTFQKWEGSPIDYRMIVTGPEGTPGINGGMLKRPCPAPAMEQGTNAYICTVDVDDVDATVAKAQEMGCLIALPKMPIPGTGWLAYIVDTEGNTLGLMQMDASAK